MTENQGQSEVGSLAAEAVKLLDALQQWGRESRAEQSTETGSARDLLRELDEHIATGGRDCTYCPICQTISLVRTTSPEVRQHLGTAATSLMQAASALLAARSAPKRENAQGVEHIDLTEDTDDWGEDR